MSNLLRFSLISIFVTFVCTNETDMDSVDRIMLGTVTSKGDWPFLAALFYGNEQNFFCGGTIISVRHVLTGNDELILILLNLVTKNTFFSCPLYTSKGFQHTTYTW